MENTSHDHPPPLPTSPLTAGEAYPEAPSLVTNGHHHLPEASLSTTELQTDPVGPNEMEDVSPADPEGRDVHHHEPEDAQIIQVDTSSLEPTTNVARSHASIVAISNAQSPPPTPPAKLAIFPGRPIFVPNDSDHSLPLTPIEKPTEMELNGRHESRPRTPGLAPPDSASHRRSLTIPRGHTVSVVLISSALETILASKEAKRSGPLRDSAQHALEMVRSGLGGDRPREIFEPLRLACETRNEKLMIASLDCTSKLISYSFFMESTLPAKNISSPPPSPTSNDAPLPLVDLVANTITACHTETTPEAVSLQIVKALLSLVLSSTILVHHSSLLKAVRTVYNVFLLSNDPVNQMVAQGGLTQMVHHVFTRCTTSTIHGESLDASTPLSSQGRESMDSPSRTSFASSRRPSLPPPATPPSNRETYTVSNESESMNVSAEPELIPPDGTSARRTEMSSGISVDSVKDQDNDSGDHTVNTTLYVNPILSILL
jgi:brefeldin A-inhibited guanine nucleotide-exchange protein